MITEVRIQGFKRLRDVTVRLGRLQVVVGNNGVGKSSLLLAIERLVGAFAADGEGRVPSAQRWFGAGMVPANVVSRPGVDRYDVFARRSDGQMAGVLCSLPSDGQSAGRCVLRAEGQGRPNFLEEIFLAVGVVGDGWPAPADRPRDWPRPALLRLHADAIAAPSWSVEDTPRLGPDGAGLASVLQYLAGLRDERLARIEADVAKVVPEVKQLRALPASISKVDMVDVSIDGQHTQVERERTVSGARFEADIAGVGWTRAEQLSEGTLLVLALVTQLHYHRPGLLLLDDLDRSLHPTAQVALVKVLRTLLEQHPELQILASTHSPYLVDELEGSEVLVAGETAPGTTQVRPLTDHPDWDAHRETLRSGELWSAVAEGWVGESK